MEGPVQWAALIFICLIILACLGLTIRAIKIVSQVQKMFSDKELRYEVALAELTKDVRHIKNNLAQHAISYTEMREEQIRTNAEVKAEVQRLAKLVNGKH